MQMRRMFALLCLAVALCLPNLCSAGLMDHPRIAVIPFANQSADLSVTVSDGILEDMREIVEIDLKNTGMFQTLERVDVDKLIAEHQFDRSGLVDVNTAAKLGKMLGAEYLLLGSVTDISREGSKYEARVGLRLVNVETASVDLAGRGKAEASSAKKGLEEAVEDALAGKRGILTMLRGGRK
ncbi:MAG: hypothetical protein IJ849_01645 [Selenomonadaceae bacterium]|nr:hypothetical protein [Selenomonadaceae bacterium]